MVGGKGSGAGVAKAKAAIAKVVAPQGDHAAQHPVRQPKPIPLPRPNKPAVPIVTEHTRGQAHPAEPVFHAEGPQVYHQAYARNAPFAKPGPYQTVLSAPKERAFRRWVAANRVPFDPAAKIVDYDMRGYWNATGGKGWTNGQHFPDTYKTPYDSTFSRQSVHSTADNPFDWRGNNLVDLRSGQTVFSDQSRPAGRPPAKPAIHGLITKPATPIVTEHTRGQAHAAPDTRREAPGGFLPPDTGQSTAIIGGNNQRGTIDPTTRAAKADNARRVAAYLAGHPNDPVAGLANLIFPNIEAALLPPVGPTAKLQRAKTHEANALDVGVAGAAVKQLYGEARHPFRHPLNTGLDAAALVSGGFGILARGSEAARAASLAEDASRTRAAMEAFARRPSANALTPSRLLPGGDRNALRTVSHLGGKEQFRQTSNPVAAVAQHAADRFAEAHPTLPVVGSAARVARQGRKTLAIRQERVAAKAIHFGEATRHIRTGSPQDVALGRLVSYGVDDPKRATELLDAEIRTHRARAETTVADPSYVERGGHKVLVQPPGTISPVQHRDLLAQADALEKARPYMADAQVVAAAKHGRDLAQLTERMRVEGGHLTQATADASVHRRAQLASGGHIVPETPGRLGLPSPALARERARVARLQDRYERAHEVASKRIRPATEYDPMNDKSLQRIGGALSVAKDRLKVMEETAAKRVAPTGMQGANDVQAGDGAAFLPSMPRTSRVQGGAGGGVPLGKQRKLVHQATGSLFEQGREELSGKKMVASHFFTTAKRSVQDQMVAEKITPFSVPIRPGEELLPGHVLHNPQGLAVARRTRELPPASVLEASTPHEVQAAVKELHAEDVKTHGALFPTADEAAKLPADERAGLRQIDQRIAESYHPAPSVPATGAAGVARDLLDATNNITRAALIYLNPSYIPRNYASNVAFLALHQGPFMAKNLARASKTLGDLKPETLHGIDIEVGGGAAKGMMEASTGRHTRASHTRAMEKIATFQNKVADQGPRRAAWIHEAAARGYKTPEQIHELLTSKTLEPELTQVSLDARRAMVDFGDLTPTERKVVQRAIFIYPWLKGATRYVKDLVVDRPVAAAIAGHISTQAGQLQKKAYGSIDARLSNVMPVGAARTAFGTTVMPVRNVTSMTPIGQGEDVAKAAYHAVAGGGTVQNFLDQFLQPGFAASIAAIHPPTGTKPLLGNSALGEFVNTLAGTPQRPNFPAAGLVKYAISKDQGPVKGPVSKQTDYIAQGARGHGVWGWLKRVGEYAALGSARERLLNVPAAQAKSASKPDRAAARANALVDHARIVIGDKRVPVYVHRAANAVALHASNRASHPNTAQGRAAADIETAVELRKITRAKGDQLKATWSKLPDVNVQALLNSYAGAWFGPPAGVVGQYLGRAAALENARKAIKGGS